MNSHQSRVGAFGIAFFRIVGLQGTTKRTRNKRADALQETSSAGFARLANAISESDPQRKIPELRESLRQFEAFREELRQCVTEGHITEEDEALLLSMSADYEDAARDMLDDAEDGGESWWKGWF